MWMSFLTFPKVWASLEPSVEIEPEMQCLSFPSIQTVHQLVLSGATIIALHPVMSCVAKDGCYEVRKALMGWRDMEKGWSCPCACFMRNSHGLPSQLSMADLQSTMKQSLTDLTSPKACGLVRRNWKASKMASRTVRRKTGIWSQKTWFRRCGRKITKQHTIQMWDHDRGHTRVVSISLTSRSLRSAQ